MPKEKVDAAGAEALVAFGAELAEPNMLVEGALLEVPKIPPEGAELVVF